MTGYLFEHRRRDANSPDGVRVERIIAVADSREEARVLAADILPAQSLHLMYEGADLVEAAERNGVGHGEAKALGELPHRENIEEWATALRDYEDAKEVYGRRAREGDEEANALIDGAAKLLEIAAKKLGE